MNRRTVVVFTVFLITIVSLCMGSKALGNEEDENYRSEYYRNIEKAYVESVRDSLEDMGYKNAGITITRIVNEGYVDYTVTVHHSRIDLLDEAQRSELTDIILMEPIGIINSSVHVRYLEYM